MILAVASGKGGTGKTTISVGLARVAAGDVTLLDCDVEGPNAALFLHPEIESRSAVSLMVPAVDQDRCTACGRCDEICRYHAIVSLGNVPIVFPDLCHSCLGCLLVCEQKALSVEAREIGILESGWAGPVRYAGGCLRIGEAMATPLVREVRKKTAPAGLTIIDAPPGTACPAIHAIAGADYLLLVTEPTPFGLHDLKLTVQLGRKLGLDLGVVVNRADIGGRETRDYCERSGIPVLAEIPEDRRIAEAGATGAAVVSGVPEYRTLFEELLAVIRKEVAA